jgi:uncharacterized paraquat-inducible protein A
MNWSIKVEPSRCPNCNFTIAPQDIRIGPAFNCPRCEKDLRVNTTYNRSVRLFSFVLGCMLAYGSGFRDILVVLFGMMFGAVVLVAVQGAAKQLCPPALESSTSYLETLDLTKRH